MTHVHTQQLQLFSRALKPYKQAHANFLCQRSPPPPTPCGSCQVLQQEGLGTWSRRLRTPQFYRPHRTWQLLFIFL